MTTTTYVHDIGCELKHVPNNCKSGDTPPKPVLAVCDRRFPFPPSSGHVVRPVSLSAQLPAGRREETSLVFVMGQQLARLRVRGLPGGGDGDLARIDGFGFSGGM